MIFTPEGLKKMAAQNVASLKCDGVALNDSITKMAMDNELNSDQVKRLIETTNQVAYISQLEDKDDRTFEFPVAEYDTVMDGMIGSPIEKAASAPINPMDLVSMPFGMEKVAQEKEATIEKWGKGQKIQALKKVASQARVELDELRASEHDHLVKLAQARETILRDREGLEKMAKFDNQLSLTRLVYGHDKVAQDVHKVWADSDLDDIRDLSSTILMAKTASERIQELSVKVDKAEGIIKEAFLASAARSGLGSISRVGSKIKGKAGKAAAGVTAAAGGAYAAGQKAFTVADTYDSVKRVNEGTSRKHDVWASLRG